jgi:phosphatidylserine synthase
MHAEIKSGLSGLFAWVGIPVLFAGVARLTFSLENHGHWPATLSVNIVLLGIMLAFVAVGTLAIRQGKPRGAFVSPIYAIAMLVILFAVLAFTGCLSGQDCTT